jgi:hypothetical protein
MLFHVRFMFVSCEDIEGIQIALSPQATVAVGEEFTTTMTLSNSSGSDQELFSVDVGDDYHDGFILMSSEPLYLESTHIPIDNSISYTFHQTIPAGGSLELRFHWKAVKMGDFNDEMDFCINSEFNFISMIQRTIVN